MLDFGIGLVSFVATGDGFGGCSVGTFLTSVFREVSKESWKKVELWLPWS